MYSTWPFKIRLYDLKRSASRASEAGVTFLCELGLDPGIDHMGAMELIDTARREKKEVREGNVELGYILLICALC
jgi:saccharopine dehydrogenase-like NADP-dependent oxidoreductase